MSERAPDVDPKPHKRSSAECPRCSQQVDGFQIDEAAIDDVTIRPRPCGCAAHSRDGHYQQFIELVKGPGGIS